MSRTITLAVSTPSNKKGNTSTYCILDNKDGKFTRIRRSSNFGDESVDSSVLAFCYLVPKDRSLYGNQKPSQRAEKTNNPVEGDCTSNINTEVEENETNFPNFDLKDDSDYMLICRSNGIIEVVKDYRQKIYQNSSLCPQFLWKCFPDDIDPTGDFDFSIANLSYFKGLLYCCTTSGKVYIFILNLPEDYIQVENLISNSDSNKIKDMKNDGNGGTTAARNISPDEDEFFKLTQYRYCGKTDDICYFLIPIDEDTRNSILGQQKYTASYSGAIMYKSSGYNRLDQGIANFQINPLDRLSFIVSAQRSPLMIRKVVMTRIFVIFLRTYLKKKLECQPNQYLQSSSLIFNLDNDIANMPQIDHRLWNSIIQLSGTAPLQSIIVWKQKFGGRKDEIDKLLHNIADNQNVELAENLSISTRPLSRGNLMVNRSQDSLFRRINYMSRQLTEKKVDTLLKSLKKNTFPIDFCAVQLLQESQQHIFNGSYTFNDEPPSDVEDDVIVSFLTDKYRNLDIYSIEKFLKFHVFRPRLMNEPLVEINVYPNHQYSEFSNTKDSRERFDEILSQVCSFKKLFVLTEKIILIIGSGGVLLLDRSLLKYMNHLSDNPIESICIIKIDLGLLNDAILLVDRFETCKDCSGVLLNFQLITTNLSGEINSYNCMMRPHSRIGSYECTDSIQLTKVGKFVDKLIFITDFKEQVSSRKRSQSDIEMGQSRKKQRSLSDNFVISSI